MQDRFVAGIAGYLPLLRFDRAAARRALRFSGLGGGGKGWRALSGWDEDPVTMAVEAGRLLDAEGVSSLVFASTSAPFFERSHATLAAAALALPESIATSDVGGSRRCATGALRDALLGTTRTAVLAGEKRATKPGSAQQAGFGDGGAAALIGDAGGALFLGYASRSHDFLDFYSSREHPQPYAAEERFVREAAIGELVAPTIRAACADAGVTPARIAHAAAHEPLPGMWAAIAKATGIGAPNHASELEAAAGDLGASHPLFALGLAFAAAQPGEIVLLTGFGSGCDVLLFEMVGAVAGAETCATALKRGRVTDDFARFLALTGSIDLDWGVRSEFGAKSQATVTERYGRDMLGFIGGRDVAGNVQFPKSNVPVRPDSDGSEGLSDVRLADSPAKVLSVTADRLNYTPDPPFWFGLVQFENGARVLMELTDAPPQGFAVGDQLAMRLRIKNIDRSRGNRTYFWKAAPVERPVMEA